MTKYDLVTILSIDNNMRHYSETDYMRALVITFCGIEYNIENYNVLDKVSNNPTCPACLLVCVHSVSLNNKHTYYSRLRKIHDRK